MELPPAVTAAILASICVLAFAIRLFPVVFWGSVIHEFDPQFNYRVAKFVAQEGGYELLNWFDDRTWYPLGRIVGTTVYPGLMLAAAAIHWAVNFFTPIDLNVRHACVMVAPIFAAFSCVAIFWLTKDVTRNALTALLAAALIAISPAYISRSTAGSFDNEGVAIFLLIFTFYLWVKAVRTGSMLTSALTALAYFAMAFSWGGYVFIINVIPIHVVALLFSRNYSTRVYVAYSTFYPIATLLSMQVPFIGFNAVLKGEAAASHGVFLLLQGFALLHWISGEISQGDFAKLLRFIILAGVVIVATGVIGAMALGKLQWSGRSLTLLDPTYASKYIPIIASVGEHQPTTWAAFYFSLGPTMLFVPLGVYYSLKKLNEGYIFMIVYSVFAFYFAGVMVRLLLTLAPAACFLSAVGLSTFMDKISNLLCAPAENEAKTGTPSSSAPELSTSLKSRKFAKFAKVPAVSNSAKPAGASSAMKKKEEDSMSILKAKLRFEDLPPLESSGSDSKFPRAIGLLLFACAFLLVVQVRHSATASHKAFSSTQLVFLKRNMTTGSSTPLDDYREAYAWLRDNTPDDAKILSWWDYGYQITTFANRTVLVDNNTWNNTHIATVGRVLASSEEDAYPILRSLDVDYVLVLFGGKVGMGGDDLDKLSWIIRITEGVFPDAVLESEYKTKGRYILSANATLAMRESVAYKLCYHDFNRVEDEDSSSSDGGNAARVGLDVGRKSRISPDDIVLRHFEPAFTTESWLLRIYRVKKD